MSPGSRLQSRELRPTTASARISLTLSETPVYRAGQTIQQLRFPGRRTVVRKYGKGNSEPSPRQRTLTQIGYILHERQYDLQDAKFMPDEDGSEPQPSREVDINVNADIDDNKARLGSKQLEHTPKKRRSNAVCDTAQSVLATPATVRTEIPSSQPSPFTPMLLLGSPSSDPHSSPLRDGSLDLVLGCGLDAERVARNPKDPPDHFAKRRKSSPALEPQPCLANLSPHSKTGCSNQERSWFGEATFPGITTRSSSRGGLGSGTILHKSQGDGAGGSSIQGRTRRESQRHISLPRSAEEIPDTDDEEDKGKVFSRSALRNPASTPQHATSTAGSNLISLRSPLSSFCRSSPPTLEPRTPTPRPRERRLYTAGRIEAHQAGHGVDIERGQTLATLRTAFSLKTDEGATTFLDIQDDEPRFTPPNAAARNGTRLETLHQLGPGFGRQCGGKQQDLQSQGLESQRVPLDVISRFKPHTDRTDIIICSDPVQVQGMVDGTRDYELRSFKIPQTVCRFWIYVTEPVCELRYMAVVAGLQQASEIDSHGDTGNVPLNASGIAIQFAYRLLQVYQMNNPVSLGTMKKNGWMDDPPTRYTYIPPAVVGSLLGNLRCVVVDNTRDGGVVLDDALPMSQCAEMQHACPLTTTQSCLKKGTTGGHQQSAVSGTSTVFLDPESVTVAKEGLGKAPQCQGRVFRAATGSASAAQVPATPIGLSQDARSVPTTPRPDEPTASATFSRAASTSNSKDTRRATAVARTNRAMQAQWRQVARHGIQSQNLALSEARVSQLDLPDSLYEEMRQAPPVVVLNSDDSEDE